MTTAVRRDTPLRGRQPRGQQVAFRTPAGRFQAPARAFPARIRRLRARFGRDQRFPNGRELLEEQALAADEFGGVCRRHASEPAEVEMPEITSPEAPSALERAAGPHAPEVVTP